jgi:hypothetical protein
LNVKLLVHQRPVGFERLMNDIPDENDNSKQSKPKKFRYWQLIVYKFLFGVTTTED